jgi:hypothetical protein
MTPEIKSPCTLNTIFARQAPLAVIFRRTDEGVQLIKWNVAEDKFEFGEWFYGNVFVRRCDLSPDGTELIYFASKEQNEEYDPVLTNSWTAVSQIPSFKPTVVFPKGDKVAGGGLFHEKDHIWLNHRSNKAHPQHQIRAGLFVNSNPYAAGDDYPIYGNRLERDGWRYKQHGDFRLRGGQWVAEREEICVKLDPTRRYSLQMVLHKIERSGSNSSFHYRFSVEDLVSGRSAELTADDWADWDCRGRLTYSHGPLLYAGAVQPDAVLDLDVVADFTTSEPKNASS